jgi:hypothetical protein
MLYGNRYRWLSDRRYKLQDMTFPLSSDNFEKVVGLEDEISYERRSLPPTANETSREYEDYAETQSILHLVELSSRRMKKLELHDHNQINENKPFSVECFAI